MAVNLSLAFVYAAGASLSLMDHLGIDRYKTATSCVLVMESRSDIQKSKFDLLVGRLIFSLDAVDFIGIFFSCTILN